MKMPKDCDDERAFYGMKVALHLDHDGAVTIETIADESDMTVPEVRAGLEELMDRKLITSTPAWKYRGST